MVIPERLQFYVSVVLERKYRQASRIFQQPAKRRLLLLLSLRILLGDEHASNIKIRLSERQRVSLFETRANTCCLNERSTFISTVRVTHANLRACNVSKPDEEALSSSPLTFFHSFSAHFPRFFRTIPSRRNPPKKIGLRFFDDPTVREGNCG